MEMWLRPPEYKAVINLRVGAGTRIFFRTQKMYLREMVGKDAAWSMEIRPERSDRERKKLMALASMSKILSAICRSWRPPAWIGETVREPRVD